MKRLKPLTSKWKEYPWTVYTGMLGASLALIGGIILTLPSPEEKPAEPETAQVENANTASTVQYNEEAALPTKKYFYKRALLKARQNADDQVAATIAEMDKLMNSYPQDAVVIQKIATYLNENGASETYTPTQPDMLMERYDPAHEFLDVNSAISQFYHGQQLPIDVKNIKLNQNSVAFKFDDSWIYGNPEQTTYTVNAWYTNGERSIIFVSVGGKRAVMTSTQAIQDGVLTVEVLHDPILSEFEQ